MLEHLYERARKRTGPSYFGTKAIVISQRKTGTWFTVKKLVKIQEGDPSLAPYLGQKGVCVQVLPNEWDLGVFYRLEFPPSTGLEPLAFLKRELLEQK